MKLCKYTAEFFIVLFTEICHSKNRKNMQLHNYICKCILIRKERYGLCANIYHGSWLWLSR